jgi:energy-coupling factor transporter ATP-binding protein EcfA2
MELEYVPRHERAIRAMLGRPVVISVYGPPGAGKTTLLKHCEDLVWRQSGTTAVYADLKMSIATTLLHRDIPTSPVEIQREAACHTIQSLAQGLSDTNFQVTNTLNALQRRSQLAAGIAADASFQAAVAKTFGEKLVPQALDWLVSRFMPLGHFGALQLFISEALKRSSESLTAEITKLIRSGHRERDAALLINPIKPLTDAFVEDLKQGVQSHHCILLLDDLRLTWKDFGKWLRDLIRKVGVDQNVTWVLTSWSSLPTEWRIRGLDFLCVPLGCLRLEVFKESLGDEKLQQIKDTLQFFPRGEIDEYFLPLLIHEALEHQGSDDHCCEQLAERIREWLGDANLFKRVRQCAAARQIDRNIAEQLPGINRDNWDRIVSEGEGRFIHLKWGRRFFDSQIRYALLRHTQTRDSMAHYRQLHLPLAKFYQRGFASSFVPGAFQMPSLYGRTEKWTNFVEWFYHALSSVADPGPILLIGLQYALFRLDEPDEINPLIEVIFQVACERREDNDFSNRVWLRPPHEEEGRLRNDARLYEKTFNVWGVLLSQCADELALGRASRNWEPLYEFYQAIVERSKVDSGVAPETKAEALYWLGQIHKDTGDSEAAMGCFEYLLNLASQREGRFWDDIHKDASEQLADLDIE